MVKVACGRDCEYLGWEPCFRPRPLVVQFKLKEKFKFFGGLGGGGVFMVHSYSSMSKIKKL